jgi:hypothetical protein
MMPDKPYIEDVMMAWRADGFSWEEIDKMRKSEPYKTYPTTRSMKKDLDTLRQKMIEAGYIKENE